MSASDDDTTMKVQIIASVVYPMVVVAIKDDMPLSTWRRCSSSRPTRTRSSLLAVCTRYPTYVDRGLHMYIYIYIYGFHVKKLLLKNVFLSPPLKNKGVYDVSIGRSEVCGMGLIGEAGGGADTVKCETANQRRE